MGCDIHLHVEVKVKGRWYHYDNPYVDRRYGLFAKLGNVRNYGGIAPISLPRGLPEDVSVVTQLDAAVWGDGAHSHSWITSAEIAEVVEWGEKERSVEDKADRFDSSRIFGYFFNSTYEAFTKYPQDWKRYRQEGGLEDVRFVFWFDN